MAVWVTATSPRYPNSGSGGPTWRSLATGCGVHLHHPSCRPGDPPAGPP